MFDLQGHRGARGLYPENTLEGFAAAMRTGLRSFEIDVAVTRDGIPVVHHDPALNPDIARGLGGAWIDAPGPLIRDLDRAALDAFDVGRLRPGSRYAELWATQRPQDGCRIPSLVDVLSLEARFNVELKLHAEQTIGPEEMVERVLAVIDRAGAADRVTVQSFDWRAPMHVRTLRPQLPRGWLTDDIPVDTVPDAIADAGGGTWTPLHTTLTPDLLTRAHALGLRVIPWTVNAATDMRRLVEWGVDGLITDRPDRFE